MGLKSYGWTRDTVAEREMARAVPEAAAASDELRVWRQGAFTAIVGLEHVTPPLAGVTDPDGRRWHLSISHPSRYPTWDEIKAARYGLVPDGAWMVQVLPPKALYTNLHSNAFHLWEVAAAAVPNEVPL